MKLSLANVLVVVVLVVSIAAVISMSSSVRIGECKSKPGYIFGDCVDPSWHGISSWEMRYDNKTQFTSMDSDDDDLVQWKIIATGDEAHGNVLDVHYSRNRANGRLRFHAAGYGNTVDMSEYATGYLEFDVRLMARGVADEVLIVRVLCVYPCGSEPMRIAIPSLHQWHTIKIPVEKLVATGLDLSRVDIGLAVSPSWNRMQGYHFQLDNIRWKKGPDQLAEAVIHAIAPSSTPSEN